jgi:hypothetical protein
MYVECHVCGWITFFSIIFLVLLVVVVLVVLVVVVLFIFVEWLVVLLVDNLLVVLSNILMASCCASFCKNTSFNSKARFFRFPRCAERRLIWAQYCQNDQSWRPLDHHRLCDVSMRH